MARPLILKLDITSADMLAQDVVGKSRPCLLVDTLHPLSFGEGGKIVGPDLDSEDSQAGPLGVLGSRIGFAKPVIEGVGKVRCIIADVQNTRVVFFSVPNEAH